MFKGHQQAGFTLVEILVALALVSIILFMATGNSFSTRKNLDEMSNKIERIVRFSSDESNLKNQFVRLSVDLGEEEQSLKLEYSDNPNLILDPVEESDSVKNKEEADKKKKKFNQSFSSVQDFESSDFSLPLGVKFLAIASSLDNKLVKNENANIFFYPTGEKDSAVILLYTDSEIAVIKISAFTNEIKREYISIASEMVNDPERIMGLADEVFKEWLTE